MRLVGRDLSPFVRRIAIWCDLQGRTVERDRLAAMDPAHADALRAANPGRRVPVLVLDDGTHLVETLIICDYLDETAPDRRLVPASGTARRDCLRRIAFAQATAEKAIALTYEKNRRPEAFQWPEWQERLTDQIRATLEILEEDARDGFHGSDGPDGSDIAIVCSYQFCEVTNPWLLEGRYPKLAAMAQQAMTIPIVRETYPA